MQGETDRFTPLREQSRRLQGLRLALAKPPIGVLGTGVLGTARPPDQAEEREARRAYLTPVERAEEQEDPTFLRQKRERPWAMRAVWRHAVGPAPTEGQDAAARYLERLMEVLDQHASGHAPLTRSEAAYLRLQIAKWTLRAAGQDDRYRRRGTRPGRPRTR